MKWPPAWNRSWAKADAAPKDNKMIKLKDARDLIFIMVLSSFYESAIFMRLIFNRNASNLYANPRSGRHRSIPVSGRGHMR
jgi:hypothetical protein